MMTMVSFEQRVKDPGRFKPHPVAELFPVLDGEQLQQLADDIAANGQNHPIVLSDHTTILDGRNRLAACQLAGVEPVFVLYGGSDPVAFVISQNIHRRHLTVGQRALVAEQLATMSQGERTDLVQKRTKSRAEAAGLLNVSERSVASARRLKESPDDADLVAEVKAGDKSLGAATKEAETRRRPSPRRANEIAAEKGIAVVASDGRIYTGLPWDEMEAKAALVQRTGAIYRGLELLAVDVAAEVVPLVPEYMEERVDKALPGAMQFMIEFKEAWDDRKARRSD